MEAIDIKYTRELLAGDTVGLGFKAFDAAQATLVGIALMHMIKKQQWCFTTKTGGI